MAKAKKTFYSDLNDHEKMSDSLKALTKRFEKRLERDNLTCVKRKEMSDSISYINILMATLKSIALCDHMDIEDKDVVKKINEIY